MSHFRNWGLNFSTDYDEKCSESPGEYFDTIGEELALALHIKPVNPP